MAGLRQIRLAAARIFALLAVVMFALAPIGGAQAHAGHDHAGHAHPSHVPASHATVGHTHGLTTLSGQACDPVAANAEFAGASDSSVPAKSAPHPDCCWTWHVSAIPAGAGTAAKRVLRGSPIIAANRTAPPDVVPERLPEPPRPFA